MIYVGFISNGEHEMSEKALEFGIRRFRAPVTRFLLYNLEQVTVPL